MKVMRWGSYDEVDGGVRDEEERRLSTVPESRNAFLIGNTGEGVNHAFLVSDGGRLLADQIGL